MRVDQPLGHLRKILLGLRLMGAVEDRQLIEKRLVYLIHVVPIGGVDPPKDIVGIHPIPKTLKNVRIVIPGIAGGLGRRGDGFPASGKRQKAAQNSQQGYTSAKRTKR